MTTARRSGDVRKSRHVSRELELYAAVVHGFTAFGHALGLVHAIRKGLRFDGVVHGIALIYDIRATVIHLRDAR